MTKDELKNKIMDEFIGDFYASNLSSMIDSREFMQQATMGELEEAAFELMDDLSQSVIDTLENEGVLKVKKVVPA